MEGKDTDDLRNEFCGRFDIYEPAKVLWFGYMKEVVCNRDDLILNPLLKFEKMKGLSTGEMCKCLGVRVTALASSF